MNLLATLERLIDGWRDVFPQERTFQRARRLRAGSSWTGPRTIEFARAARGTRSDCSIRSSITCRNYWPRPRLPC